MGLKDSTGAGAMQWVRASFAAVVVSLGFGLSAAAREGNPTIASQRALVAEAPDFGSLGAQQEIDGLSIAVNGAIEVIPTPVD
jgi:hypothetical protein